MSDSRIADVDAAAELEFRTIVSILNPPTLERILKAVLKNSFCCTQFLLHTELTYYPYTE